MCHGLKQQTSNPDECGKYPRHQNSASTITKRQTAATSNIAIVRDPVTGQPFVPYSRIVCNFTWRDTPRVLEGHTFKSDPGVVLASDLCGHN